MLNPQPHRLEVRSCVLCVCVCVFLDCRALDEMGKRVDDLEKNIRDLMEQVETKEEVASMEAASRK